MVEYVYSKTKLLINRRPGDLALVNADDPQCLRAVKGLPDLLWFSGKTAADAATIAYYDSGEIQVDQAAAARAAEKLRESLPAHLRGRIVDAHDEDSNGRVKVVSWAEVPLQGEHNLENALAAAGVCICLGLAPEEIAAGLKSFAGVRHRLQEVAEVNGVLYVNDSKATNVDAAIKALTAYHRGIHLILGGSLKGCSFEALAEAAVEKKIKEVLLIGEAAEKIASSFSETRISVIVTGNLDEAVRRAAGTAEPGDVVLFAPACASFDQYKNFEQRGDHFISLVNRIAEGR
jgi:UDP-N-acetylmuramoylalanine--D-glutamate ligase